MTESRPDLLDRWRTDLAAWAIPDAIQQAAPESPWVMPRDVFINRARRMIAEPSGVSYERAREALAPSGTVLDVGCGAGAASLPLAPYATEIVGVDSGPELLDAFRMLAGDAGRTIAGRWPDVAPSVPAADVVVCHHVLYNVPDLASFVMELTEHARRRVVVEMTARHPTSNLNPLWERLHGLPRPNRPTAADAIAALRSLGLAVEATFWSVPPSDDFGSYDEMLAVTGRRLCLPPERMAELDATLRDLGVDPQRPVFTATRDLVTLWWPGRAG